MWQLLSRPEVEADLVSAVVWYDDRRAGLGREFLNEYLASVQRIHENPFQFGVAATGLRACRIRRFSYIIHFQTDDNRIVIVAVMTAGRDDGAFNDRRGWQLRPRGATPRLVRSEVSAARRALEHVGPPWCGA